MQRQCRSNIISATLVIDGKTTVCLTWESCIGLMWTWQEPGFVLESYLVTSCSWTVSIFLKMDLSSEFL
jgi:hypothetical protein